MMREVTHRFGFGYAAGLPLLAMGLLLVIDVKDLDFAVAHYFYRDGDGFPLRFDPFLEEIMHTRVRQAVLMLVASAFLAWAASFRSALLRPWHPQLSYFLIATIASAAIIHY